MRISPVRTWKDMFSRTGFWSKPMETSSKTTTGSLEDAAEGLRCSPVACHGHRPKMAIRNRLIMKSVMMIRMEDQTTAWVVERPTP